MGLTVPISTFIHSQIAQKNQNSTRLLVAIEYSKWDAILQGMSSTAHEVFQTLTGCIRQIKDISDSISLSAMGRTVQFSAKVSSQFVHKMPDCLYPLIMINEKLYYDE